ncbi:DUF3124 domain-containing protein [Nodosilinea sp. P-1105]|uniref:DUF3124 domain-containing protein n=1 Tax=Nodosilinea sp. P-1105 TaxID=2546229 RepID=UPI00146D8ADA|nr:DUF3124 domain-containing protein [Nodosilinea sp. P-1105]NMF85679.1 DUF3124 domain-containing protein [Nodosilinea sp. P-1105]
MVIAKWIGLGLLMGGAIACTPQSTAQHTTTVPTAERFGQVPGVTVLALESLPEPVMGQVVYVPVYSAIYESNRDRTFPLTTTLSLRNTDREAPIAIAAVDYYNSAGELVSGFLDQPVQLDPLASTEVVVPKEDQGGVGANFVITWQADTPVSAPVIEAVMVSTSSQQGLSFVSPGRVIETWGFD